MTSAQGYDAGTVHDLLAALRHVQTRTTFAETLQAVVDGVVAVSGFDVAVVRVLHRDGMLHCEAVAGHPDNPLAAVDVSDLEPVAVAELQAEFDLGARLGDLIFLHHADAPADVDAWVPDLPEPVEDGGWHPMDALWAPMRDDDGVLHAVLGVDLPRSGRVPDAQQAEILALFAGQAGIALSHARLAERLRRHEREFRMAFDHAVNGMALVHLDTAGRVVGGRVNPMLCELLGRTPEELATLPLSRLVAPGQDVDLVASIVSDTQDELQLRALHADGTQRWVGVTSAVVASTAELTTAILHVADIGERRRLGDELARQATRDELTGLWNRRVLDARLDQLACRIEASSEGGAVLFVDVDGFKGVNDTYGHHAGDRTLQAVGTRLQESVRPDDVVIRIGGDEFVVLLADITPEVVATVVARLEGRISRPIRVGPVAIRVTASVGVAHAGPGHVDTDALLAQADTDMYARKRLTGSGHPA
ncbi:diguanylate cyclase [Solicola sp. PLA-1-18]|uniref:diguanylate cyclase n=1 Tax=Solicola sp. PLA-1-18 TaxID=3380532 RepID=UPI003B7AEABD